LILPYGHESVGTVLYHDHLRCSPPLHTLPSTKAGSISLLLLFYQPISSTSIIQTVSC
jgi:hypothetical protein